MNCLTLMLQSFERITANQLRASRRVCASKKGPSTGESFASEAVHSGPAEFLCVARRRHSHFCDTRRKQIPVAAT